MKFFVNNLSINYPNLVAFFFGKYLLPSNQQQALLALKCLAPAILIAAFLGVLRGYFQAHNTMLPTSVSQILEQIVHAIVSVVGALVLIKSFATDAESTAIWGSVGATLGIGFGGLFALAFMMLVYYVNRPKVLKKIKKDKTKKEESFREVFGIIFLMVTPIIFNTFVYNASSYLDFSQIFLQSKVWKQHLSVHSGVSSVIII